LTEISHPLPVDGIINLLRTKRRLARP